MLFSAVLLERGVNSTAQFSQLNATAQQNATFALINNLVFAQSKSVRTSTIILAAFNVLAAFATAASILYDCYSASTRCNPKFRASKFCISSIHPAETFPLVIAIGIVVQGIVFAAVQGEGMSSLMTRNCDVIAQFMFPALFIVPYLQVVFGLECAIRSLRRMPFQARGKYDVTICMAVVAIMLIGSWIPSFIFKQPNMCFASLMWFISRYGGLGVILLSIAGGLMIISTFTIFYRLSTVNLVDQHQRIAASRMVYYLILGIMSLALVIPYFISQMISVRGGDLKLSMIATVVVNLSGLMHGLLHLFLRSNTSATSFAPKASQHWNRGKHQIRIWGPNELVFGNHLVDPVSGPRTPPHLNSEKTRSESRTRLVDMEKLTTDSLQSPAFRSPAEFGESSYLNSLKAELPTIPEPAKDSHTRESVRRHQRKQSYSLFPVEDNNSPIRTGDNATSVYDISGLVPPSATLRIGKEHRRDSSISSSATVQIGLRLSHAPDTMRESSQSIVIPPLPSTTYKPNISAAFYNNPSILPTAIYDPRPPLPKSPSPLKLFISAEPKTQSPNFTSQASPLRFNKVLPPTPPSSNFATFKSSPGASVKLTTAIYSPAADNQNTPINGLPSAGVKCPKVAAASSSASASTAAGSPSRNGFSPKRPQVPPSRNQWI